MSSLPVSMLSMKWKVSVQLSNNVSQKVHSNIHICSCQNINLASYSGKYRYSSIFYQRKCAAEGKFKHHFFLIKMYNNLDAKDIMFQSHLAKKF